MSSPVLPSEFEAVVVQPEDTLAIGIVKTYVRLPVLVYRFYRWAVLDDGSLSAEAEAWLCEGCNLLKEMEEMVGEAA